MIRLGVRDGGLRDEAEEEENDVVTRREEVDLDVGSFD